MTGAGDLPPPMLTAQQCRDQAVELERQAELCGRPTEKADYVDMARRWRAMAELASWHDTFDGDDEPA